MATEMAESIGWAPIISVGIALLTSALSVGASNQRNKRTAEDVEELKKEHAAQIAEVRTQAVTTEKSLSAYQLQVEREYPRKSDLASMEARLAGKIDDQKRDVFAKVDEIKVDIGKKGIEHAIGNAVAKALAGHTLAAKGKVPQ